jgi:predicted dehydrogenase
MMPDGPTTRLGIIGAGYIAGVHIDAASTVPGIEIAAVADTQQAAAVRLVEQARTGRPYDDVARMLEREKLDGVIVATWPSSHLELIEQCVSAGVRYVLCEKPFVTTGADALAAWDLACGSEATITEAFMYRHHPAIDRVDRLLADRALGNLDHIRASFTYVNLALGRRFATNDPDRPWRLQPGRGGGALYDIGTYAINACTHTAASLPTRVSAFGRPRNDYGTSDKVIGLIEYQNGVIGMVEASEVSDSTQELQISGDLGTLYLPFAWTISGDSQITIRRSIDAKHRNPMESFRTLTDTFTIPASNAFRDQLLNAADVMRGVAQPRVSLAETIVNTIAMEAMATSLTERQEVGVAVPDDIATAFVGEISTGSSQAVS